MSFNKLIGDLNEGSTHSALSAELAELLKTVQHTGRAGSLSIKIKIAPATRTQSGEVDKITITADRKLELPKPQSPSDFFYLTEEGETTRNHPRQHSLELRDVSTNGASHDLKKAM